MALDDTLFQLGMDLASRSSTAQKEDESAASAVDSGCKGHFVERDIVRLASTHLIIELYGARRLDDIDHIERTLKRCVEAAGETLLNVHLHRFGSSGGVSAVAVLAQSHISIHSWPAADYAALEVVMCGVAKPEVTVAILQQAFAASGTIVRQHEVNSKAASGARS
jgi:S-adenosylmethionine decarboxylase